ncbi:hypothetical protein, unlikely [Trypanosoma brucei gambiense DAL972]|uniref:Uncharacterized protein n=1 Tax=Trypanosoma brucei gambiense (strain MHOM/CI/86/DAL972) TaxID=679716 RepID=D0A0G8_TRYB9|nr:hypothetical protein, unlikely [Trypanosoma brucei gambiense DAL972]CBH16726.1 hypothetical protein, unlikely [Trypanosoma brucei gambiense DAL972]|eukprot:XP_011778990.1 hypothetical protein, unlikely [Trypanosoma brucei gambiense DAL972]
MVISVYANRETTTTLFSPPSVMRNVSTCTHTTCPPLKLRHFIGIINEFDSTHSCTSFLNPSITGAQHVVTVTVIGIVIVRSWHQSHSKGLHRLLAMVLKIHTHTQYINIYIYICTLCYTCSFLPPSLLHKHQRKQLLMICSTLPPPLQSFIL